MADGGRITRSKSKAINEDSSSPTKKKPKLNDIKQSTLNEVERSHKKIKQKPANYKKIKQKPANYKKIKQKPANYKKINRKPDKYKKINRKPDKYKKTNRKPDKYKKKTSSHLTLHHTEWEIIKHETFNIKVRAVRGTCTVWSMCLLDSGDILVTDFGSRVLKQISGETYKIRNTLMLSEKANSVCKVSETEAIVGLSNNSIQFVSTQDKLIPGQTITMDHCCLGVCVISDRICITDGKNRNVFVYDMDGNILKKVEGENIFSWNRFIVESDDGDAIYVTDRDKGLIKMDINGEVIWSCCEESLKGAFGLCTDGLGNVFVSGCDSENVVQIASDGQYRGEVVPSNMCVPKTTAVCFDRQKSKLLVAGYFRNKVHVYRLTV